MLQNKLLLSTFLISILFILLLSVFTVNETERALKLRLGKVVNASYQPGLHSKIPLFETVRFFDKRIQTLDAIPAQFLTEEKKNLIVDSFVKWRIADKEDDVINYYKTVGGSTQRAGQRLSEIIADGLRSKFGKRTIQEVVSGDRAQIMASITDEAKERAKQFGIEIIDVRIKRIELPKEVSSSVYRRMEAERERVARELRSQGEAEAVRIRAEAERRNVEVIAKAEQETEQIRGEGDATAARIYAVAFEKNPEFYAFYRSINAYRNVFSDKKDILLLQPDSAFFDYFKEFINKPDVATSKAEPEKTIPVLPVPSGAPVGNEPQPVPNLTPADK